MDLIQKACNLGFILKNKEYYLWELQKWLRDIHFIDVEPKAIRFVGDEKASYYNNYINGSMIEMKKYNSYEEALEKGLYQALLLI